MSAKAGLLADSHSLGGESSLEPLEAEVPVLWWKALVGEASYSAQYPFSPKETQVFSLSGGGWFPPSFTFCLLTPFLTWQCQIIRYPADSATQQPSDQSPLTLPSGEKNWA